MPKRIKNNMENNPKNIGDLFKTQLDSFSMEGSADEWVGLDMKLDKMSFFKFHLSHFNVYYAALIGICFSLSSAVFVDHFILHRDAEALNPITTNEYNAPQEKTPALVITEKEKTNHTVERKEEIPQRKKSETAAIEKQNKNSTAVQDVLQTNIQKDITKEETVEIPIKKEPIKPTKKVVYITQQDTLVVYDTLTVKKRKNK